MSQFLEILERSNGPNYFEGVSTDNLNLFKKLSLGVGAACLTLSAVSYGLSYRLYDHYLTLINDTGYGPDSLPYSASPDSYYLVFGNDSLATSMFNDINRLVMIGNGFAAATAGAIGTAVMLHERSKQKRAEQVEPDTDSEVHQDQTSLPQIDRTEHGFLNDPRHPRTIRAKLLADEMASRLFPY